MMTKTFQEIRNSQQVYPTQIPQDLQATINDWFDKRHVCDDDFFVAFFKRVLNRDFVRYNQLLRIEPGISDYDWLVQNYFEHQSHVQGSKSDTLTATKGGTVNIGREASDQITNSSSKTFNGSKNTEGTDTYNLTDTKVGSGSDTRAIDRNIDDSSSVSNTTTYNEENEVVGSETRTTDNGRLSKASPMSVESVSGAGITPSMPAMAWATATTQEQGGESLAGSSTDTTTHTGTVGDSGSSSSSRDEDTTETITYGKTDTATKAGTVGKVSGDTVENTETGSNTQTGTHTGSVETEYDVTDNKSGSGSNESLMREISTGRKEAPADILERAKSFIMSTSAWEWLYSRLDTCFMGIYEL